MNAYCPTTPEDAPAKASEEGEIDAGLESMHLDEDVLKNPCLDYVQHIIFSVPSATFSAGGTTFTNYADVRTAFTGGKLSEASLKEGLIAAVNTLLDPVRKHFTEDADAKAILAQVMAWKKETLVPPKGLKRLVALESTQPVHAVFAPLASPELTLGQLLTTLKNLEAAPADHLPVLYCADWSCLANNCCGGDQKVITACHTLLVECLTAVNPACMARVKVVVQSEAILKDPSQYWISVINVGRHFQLQRIRDVDESNEYAGQVVSTLMHVGDVLALAPKTIACTEVDKAAHMLAADYFVEMGVEEIAAPNIVSCAAIDSMLKPPHMLEGPANVDDQIFVLDSNMDVSRKMKRAFCEPGNVVHCPPIALADAVLFRTGQTLLVTRKEENGGNKQYASLDDMRSDFESEALHPGDLKPPVTKAVDACVQLVRDRIKAEPAAKAAEATVKGYAKKAASAKSKKK